MSADKNIGAGHRELSTGQQVRDAARNGLWKSPTFGLAPGHIQANLVVMPSKYASDFRNLCARNPVPCPLLAQSSLPGSWETFSSCVKGLDGNAFLQPHADLRRDLPRYNVYKDGKLLKSQVEDIVDFWTSDHVAFLIGCSFSFETALCNAGLVPRHMKLGIQNCPMYNTSLPLCPAGVFKDSTYVVSMRPYRKSEVEKVRDVTRPYGACHGEPIAWGWDQARALGIKNLEKPDWGEPTVTQDGRPFSMAEADNEEDGEIPVFWGCGVTPQAAITDADLEGILMAHAPGHMLVLDLVDDDIKA